MSDAQYRFLPWVRTGLAAEIAQGAASGARRAKLDLALVVDGGADAVAKTGRLYGPGDAVGIDARQVIRTDPVPGSMTFLCNYFPAIEFDAPELPWLLSPDLSPRPDVEKDRLYPWICLVVVRRDRARLVADAKPMPRLVFTGDTAGELPNLADAWLWAHAQVAGGDQPAAQLLAGDPALNLSRLLCARRLDPGTAYIACVVPTYLSGVQAGLGQPVTATIERAWPRSSGTDLPVYYSWEFSTSESDDFEALARRLEPRQLSGRVGLRPMDVHDPGGGLPPAVASGVLDMEGALQADVIAPADWPDADRKHWTDALLLRLQAPPAGPHVVTPPLYGDAEAGLPTTSPGWVIDLNTDPRTRAAAGLGTRVVQDQQDQLVAAAWEQADAVERANQVLRHAQLAQAVSRIVYTKRLQPMAAPTLFQVTAPAHARVRDGGVPVDRKVVDSTFPDSATTTAFRRTVRPDGPIGRGIGGAQPLPALVGDLAQGKVVLPILQRPKGTVALDDVAPDIKLGKATADRFDRTGNGWSKIDDVLDRAMVAVAPRMALRAQPLAMMRRKDDTPISDDPRDTGDIGETDDYRKARLINIRSRFREAAQPLQQHLLSPPPQPQTPKAQPLGLDDLKNTLAPSSGASARGVLDPIDTVPDRVLPLVPAADRTLKPLLPVPHFDQPMMLPLRDLGQEFLLPSFGEVPPETVGVLKGNARFIEAYMTGLNAALAQELLFRGYLTVPDATFFDRFWDGRTAVPGMSGPDAGPDLDPTPWDSTKKLGDHTRGVGGTGMTLLLIRGELVRQNRQLTVYLAKPSAADANDLEPSRYPDFRGFLEPDAVYLGFAIASDDLRNDSNAYFVLEEHVTAPRFGLDKQRLKTDKSVDWAGTPTTWDDVAWTDMALSPAELAALPFVPTTPKFAPLQRDGATWAQNGAHMAAITYQKPVRVAFPTSDMLRH